jgi:hypothetical protein
MPSPKPKLVAQPPAPSSRTLERQALADAHAARAQAEVDLEEAKRARARGADLAAKTATKLEAAQAEMATASEARARELAHAADMGTAAPPAITSRVRDRALDAEDEHGAAVAACDALKRAVENCEDRLIDCQNRIVAHADHLLRSAMAKRTLDVALEAAATLERARLILRMLERPAQAGQTLGSKLETVIVRNTAGSDYGERYWRGENAVKAAEAIRGDGFDGEVETEIDRALQYGLGKLHESDRQWSTQSFLAPLVRFRAALLAGDVDLPFPDEISPLVASPR